MKDDLGKRMKENYEMRSRTFLPRRTYTIIRLDGKAFHTYTRGMERPFDVIFAGIMDKTAMALCREIQGVKLAYTQSDEISLLLTDFDKITTDAWFDGNIQKMASVSASIATAYFNKYITDSRFSTLKSTCDEGGEEVFCSDLIQTLLGKKLAFFDSRIFQIPDPIEVENYFIWRQKDAVRNSIAMTAQSLYSHKELHGKFSNDQQEMIFQKGQNWNDMPEGFKRGRTIYKDVVETDSDGLVSKTDWTVHTPDFQRMTTDGEREISHLIPKIGDE